MPSPSYRGAEPLAAQWNIGLAACASLTRRKCKKSQACAWDRPARQCVAEEPEVTAASVATIPTVPGGRLAECASLRRRKCKKSRACAWDRTARQCAEDAGAAAAQGGRKRGGKRRGRKPCAELPLNKCLRKTRCTYDATGGVCADAE